MKASKKIRELAQSAHRRTRPSVCAAVALLACGMAATSPTYSNDIVVHPASCVAPFLDQARPMRWHEHFVMNPDNATEPTYLICPMDFNPSVVTLAAGGTFVVQVIGARMDTAGSGLPTCEFSVHRNTNLKQGIYLDRAPRQTYKEGLTANSSGSLWVATTTVTRTDVEDALGNANQFDWALATVCLLPLGYSISQIRLLD